MRLIRQPADFRTSDKIFIFGAGEGGQILYKSVHKLPTVKILGFIDNYKRGEFCGFPVMGLDDALKRDTSARIVIASSYASEIATQLKASGIIDFDNALPLINAYNGRWTERKRRLKALMTVLVFFGILIWLLV